MVSREERIARFLQIQSSSYQVAVLSSIETGVPGEVLYGLRQCNEVAEKQFYPVHYHSMGLDNDSVVTTIHSVLAEQYPVIVCVGLAMTEAVYALTKDLPNPPAVVFALTGRPVTLGLIKSMQSSGNHMIGVELGQEPAPRFLEYFFQLRPEAQKVLLPCTVARLANAELQQASDDFSAAQTDPIVQALERRGVSVTVLPCPTPEAALDSIRGAIVGHDTLILGTGDSILSMHGPIGATCNKEKVVFCANLRSAVRASASFGYAQSYIGVGFEVARCIQDIFFNNMRPSDMPTVRLPDEQKLLINTVNAQDQGLDPEIVRQRAGDEAEVFEKRAIYPVYYDESC